MADSKIIPFVPRQKVECDFCDTKVVIEDPFGKGKWHQVEAKRKRSKKTDRFIMCPECHDEFFGDHYDQIINSDLDDNIVIPFPLRKKS